MSPADTPIQRAPRLLRCPCGGIYRYEATVRFGYRFRCEDCSYPGSDLDYSTLHYCAVCDAMYEDFQREMEPGQEHLCPDCGETNHA